MTIGIASLRAAGLIGIGQAAGADLPGLSPLAAPEGEGDIQLAAESTGARIYKDVTNGIAPAGIEYWLPLFFDETAIVDKPADAAAPAATPDAKAAPAAKTPAKK